MRFLEFLSIMALALSAVGCDDGPGDCVLTNGGVEACNDNIDNNCDGQIDEGCCVISNGGIEALRTAGQRVSPTR